MKIVLKYLKPYLLRMELGLAIKFIATVAELVIPWILSHIIDNVIPLGNLNIILLWGGAMILAAILAAVANIVANRMAAWVAQHTTETLRHDLFARISLLSCSQVDEYTIPSLEARLTTDSYNIHQVIGMMQRIGVRAPILLIGGILITLTLDPVLTLVLVCTLPLIALSVFTISRKGIPLYRDLQRGVDSMVRVVRENITGIRVIKALSKTDYEMEHFSQVNEELVRREKKAAFTMSFSNPLVNLILNIGLVAVILTGAYRVNLGLSQPGKIIAFLSYFTIILNALMALNRIFIMYTRASASGSRIAQVMDTPEDLSVTSEEAEKTEAHVKFSHVSFGYNQKNDIVKDVSFTVKKGEILGIIGATGCGKSTLISLLLRLYDCEKGKITISGRNVASIPPEELHTKFGVVFQNDSLLADTIYNNIDYGRNLPREAIHKAARCAQAMEFISQTQDGFDHMLTSRGTNLSGGQKQRLLVARALAGSPEILILDDSSSALDYATDALLRKALREEYAGTTTLIVAQRVSSILHSNHILVLEKGQELGFGTHEELLKSCDLYREIVTSQMGEVDSQADGKEAM